MLTFFTFLAGAFFGSLLTGAGCLLFVRIVGSSVLLCLTAYVTDQKRSQSTVTEAAR